MFLCSLFLLATPSIFRRHDISNDFSFASIVLSGSIPCLLSYTEYRELPVNMHTKFKSNRTTDCEIYRCSTPGFRRTLSPRKRRRFRVAVTSRPVYPRDFRWTVDHVTSERCQDGQLWRSRCCELGLCWAMTVDYDERHSLSVPLTSGSSLALIHTRRGSTMTATNNDD